MGLLGNNRTRKAFSQETCYFLPGGKSDRSVQHVGLVSVRAPKAPHSGIKFNQVLSLQSVQAAWALLLRAYLSKEVVSFAQVTTSYDGRASVKSSARELLDTTEAALCQYQSIGERQQGDLGPDLVLSLTQHDVESGRVNTAVVVDLQNSDSPDETQSLGLSYRHGRALYEVGRSPFEHNDIYGDIKGC